MATFRGLFVRKDATRGVQPAEARLALAGLLTPASDVGALAGVISGLVVSGVAGQWYYAVSGGHATTVRSSTDGANLPGLDGVTNTPTVAAAPGSGSRWDLIWIKQNDVDNADSDSSSALGVTQGTASGSPTKPYGSVPAGALVLSEAQVGAGATGTLHANVVISQVAQRTGVRGGIVPVAAAAFGNGTYVGQYIDDPTSGLMRWNGSAWVAVANAGAWTAYTPTIGGVAAPTVGYARYTQVGKTVTVQVFVTVGAGGVAGNLTISCPVTPRSGYVATLPVGIATANSGAVIYTAPVEISGSTLIARHTDTGFWGPGRPMTTWVSGNTYSYVATYEAA